LDEVFGAENEVAQVSFVKNSGQTDKLLSSNADYLLWYARDRGTAKFNRLFYDKSAGTEFAERYDGVEVQSGERRSATAAERDDPAHLSEGARLYTMQPAISHGFSKNTTVGFALDGRTYHPGIERQWKTTVEGMATLARADRLAGLRAMVYYVRFLDDFPVYSMGNVWSDTQDRFSKNYVVQTVPKVVERCVLMTTDPGDLVFDPTCGSGTTAFCAEKWGRRWVTCDTSRVALAIARQRLLTAKYDYYELQDAERGPGGGFRYETVPHITLESIAKNPEIDAIAAKFQPEIDLSLKSLNRTLGVKEISRLVGLARNDIKGGGPSADSRKPLALMEWEVPREAEKDWPKDAKEALREFWAAKRKKRQEIDATIQRNAPQETLYDKPFKKSGVVRVSGPFTVEAIPAPAVEAPDAATPVPQFETSEAEGRISDKAGDYLSDMIGLLKQQGGVIFPKGRKMELANIRAVSLGFVQAEAEAGTNGKAQKVAISFGPQHGPVTAYQVQESTPAAKMNGYDVLLFCGFSFDPEARALIQKTPVKGLTVEFVNVAPDVLVGDLLKTGRASQIFTAFGEPDVKVTKGKDDTYVVELAGVDIYDPLTGKADSTRGDDAAAWFLDTDYDGMTFHICQAFFPGDRDAWDKLQRALKAQIEPETFELMRGTRTFPFQAGKHKRIAVKVIDFRGNEVPRVMGLPARRP
jgi:adenine-specific DNA-methyltransferase